LAGFETSPEAETLSINEPPSEEPRPVDPELCRLGEALNEIATRYGWKCVNNGLPHDAHFGLKGRVMRSIISDAIAEAIKLVRTRSDA
jgi:hypothetical protein